MMRIGEITRMDGIQINFQIIYIEIVESLLVIIRSGGLQGGGINFDAKTRRNSTDLNDLFYFTYWCN